MSAEKLKELLQELAPELGVRPDLLAPQTLAKVLQAMDEQMLNRWATALGLDWRAAVAAADSAVRCRESLQPHWRARRLDVLPRLEAVQEQRKKLARSEERGKLQVGPDYACMVIAVAVMLGFGGEVGRVAAKVAYALGLDTGDAVAVTERLGSVMSRGDDEPLNEVRRALEGNAAADQLRNDLIELTQKVEINRTTVRVDDSAGHMWNSLWDRMLGPGV